jgi:hypothetical protein
MSIPADINAERYNLVLCINALNFFLVGCYSLPCTSPPSTPSLNRAAVIRVECTRLHRDTVWYGDKESDCQTHCNSLQGRGDLDALHTACIARSSDRPVCNCQG